MGPEARRWAVGLDGSSSCECSFALVIGQLANKRLHWFRLFLAFVAYFVIGAYYNYSTYGASGADLIPYVLSLSRILFEV